MTELELNKRIFSIKRTKYPVEDAIESFFVNASNFLFKKARNTSELLDKLMVLSLPMSLIFLFIVALYRSINY